MAVDKNKKKDNTANDAANDKKDGAKPDDTADKADEPADKSKTYNQADVDALLKNAEKAAKKGVKTMWHPMYGGHCVVGRFSY